MDNCVWEGVYTSFQEVPKAGSGFFGAEWIQNSLKKISKLREISHENKTIPSIPEYRETLLPVVASMVHNNRGRIRILDFGGGIGATYFQVLKSLECREGFEYHIIDLKEVCDAGQEFFKDEPQIFFHITFPQEIRLFDIVHLGSSLHYVEKWKRAISELSCYQPKYFLFTDLAAGDIPTYATRQNYYGSMIPMWFFNVTEIKDFMYELGFKLIFKSTYIPKIFGREQPYPQNNFDEKYRLGTPCILLFAMREKK